MKRTIPAILLYIACLLLLSSCGKSIETEWSELQMAQNIWNTQQAIPCETLSWDGEDLIPYLSDAYNLAASDVTGGAVLSAGGINAQEIAVLRLKDQSAVKNAQKALDAYIDARAGAFAGYVPEQYAILEKSGTVTRGTYIALLICPDQDTAEAAFDLCFTVSPPRDPAELDPNAVLAFSEPEPEPAPELEPEPESESEPAPDPAPETDAEWAYDESRIIEAWTSGNRDGLCAEDLAILSVLDEIPALTDPELSDYDRELALHDWMLDWAEYDPGALSSGPVGEPMPDNDNPYGFLLGRKGICLGYATTFQLFMDLSGIECLTVRGLAHHSTEEHAWNLVNLENEWYAVDVTWDDPVTSLSFLVSESLAHNYFNVTSDYLRQNDHQWDESAFPEAEGTALAWSR